MCKRSAKKAFVSVVALMLLSSAITAVMVPVSANGHTDPPPADETVEVDTNVEVWDRAFLTTRANTSDAAATIPNADWRVNNKDNDETNLNRDPIPVYKKDQTVSIQFDEALANKGGVFNGDEVEIIAAHVEESGEGSVPSSVSDGVDLLTEENANDNASFESLGTPQIESDGTLDFDFTPDQTGHYVLFLAKEDGTGFNVTNNEISVESKATVVGMEHLMVRKGTGSISVPNSVTRGESVDLDVDATNVAGDNIKQAVVLYDEDTYVTESFVVDIQDDLTNDFDIEANSALETTISDVNGVATLEEDVSALNVDLNDGTVSRTAGIASIVDFIGEEAGTDTPDTVVTGSTELDGSLTVVNRTSQDTTITVDTFQNWSTGDYRWAYIAVGDSSQEMVMDTGEVPVYTRLSTVDAGSDQTVNTGDSVSFSASTSNSDQVASYEWDWTDDGTYDASGSTASHSYSSADTYTVRLRVTDHSGVTYTDTATVNVNEPSPSPSPSPDPDPEPEPEPEPDPEISVSSGSLSFGDVSVGSSATETVTVSNTGDGTLDIDPSVSGSSAFSASVDETSVASGSSTTVTVTFEPGAADTYSGDLEIQSNDPDAGTTTVSLSGTGAEAEPSVSPSSVDFGEQFVNTLATEQITISNDGNAPLTVDSFSLSGDTDQFSVDAESVTVGPGESESVAVDFLPTVADTASATLTVGASDETFDVALTGTGVASDVSLSPLTTEYGAVAVGNQSDATFTIENDGDAPVDLGSIQLSGTDAAAFELTQGENITDTALEPGESRTLTVSFAPERAGGHTARLQLTNGSGTVVGEASLSGTGQAGQLELTPATADYGTVSIRNDFETEFSLANTGNASLAVGTAEVTGPDGSAFTVTEEVAGTQLAPGENRTVTVEFAPNRAGRHTATLAIATADDRDSATASLRGTAQVPSLGFANDTEDLGSVAITQEAVDSAVLENTGNTTVQLGTFQLAGDDTDAFEIQSPVENASLAPDSTREITVAFTPERGGPHSALLQATNASGVVIAETELTGTGQAPRIALKPSALTFDDATVNETSSRSFAVRNRGNATLTVTDLRFTGPRRGFALDASTPFTVGSNESRSVDVTFTPEQPAPRMVNVVVESDDPENQRRAVSLTNTRAEINVTSTSDNNETQVNARVNNAEANVRVPVAVLEEDSSTENKVSVGEVSITPNQSGNFTANISTPQTLPEGAPEFDTETGTEALDHADVNTSLSNENISQAEFTFRVNKSTLEELQSEPEDINMYRAGENGWERRPANLTNETNSAYVFRTSTSKLSSWTVGAEQPQISVDSAETNLTTATVGQTVNIRVSLLNTGGSDGVYTTELLINETVVESESTTVPPNGSRIVTFERGFDQPGTYSVQVNDVFVGSVSIDQDDDTTVTTPTPTTPGEPNETTAPGETDTTTSDDGDGGSPLLPIVIIAVVVIAIAAAALWLREQ